MDSDVFREVPQGSILVVAPYSPIGSGVSPHLGAAKKIASVVRLMSRSGRPVVLVNSAHNVLSKTEGRISSGQFGYGVAASVVDLPTTRNRRIGKALNIVSARSIARAFAQRDPALVWIYNPYAFESRFGLAVKALTSCPLVLELEDWPTARSRGLNPKPVLDRAWLERVIPEADLITCVNEKLQVRLGSASRKTLLLPSIIDPGLDSKIARPVPFTRASRVLGYFGGLSTEKGAAVLLQLAHETPPPWEITVTGGGPLAAEFRRVALERPDSFTFAENVSDGEVHERMLNCDAIVNPHRSIANLGDGIFPFKVFEALATSRLLISTPLPECGFDLSKAVLWFDGSVGSLRAGLVAAEGHFTRSRAEISSLAALVSTMYSEDGVHSALQHLLPTIF